MSEQKKHEPVTIDVTPDKVEIERPARPVHVRRAPPRSPVAAARDIERMGRIVQSPNFWLGLIAEMWRTRR